MSGDIQTSVEIPAPVDDVWERLAAIETHVDWMSDAASLDFLTEERTGPGTTIRVRTRVGPLWSDDVMEFTGWEPPRSMTVRHVGRVSGSGEFRLEPIDGGTRMTWIERLRFPWFMGGPITSAVARPILRRIFRNNLRRFRATFV